MRIGLAFGIGLGACGLVLLAAPKTAWAVAAPPCVAAKMFPTAAIVPANLPGFGYTALKATSTDVHLWNTSSGRVEVPVVFGGVVDGLLKVTPSTPLVAGTSYELEYSPSCNFGSTTNPGPYKFTATTAAPIPTKIGLLQGTPVVATKDFGTTQFTIDASYTFDAEMKPWASVYQLIIVLDGRIVGTKASLTGTDSVKVSGTGWCDGTNAATQQHALQLRAKLPFAPTLETASAPLTFNCPAPAIVTPPNSIPPGAPGSTGTTPPPSGTTTNGTSSGSNVNPGGTTTTSSGGNSGGSTFSCAMTTSPSSPSSSSSATSAMLFLLTVLSVATGRRRQRAS